MRTVIAFAACTLAAASPVWAQSNMLTGPRTLTNMHVMCTDLPAVTRPAPTLFIKGGHNTDGHSSMVKGEIVVLNRTAGDGLQSGQHYFVRRLHGVSSRGFFSRESEGYGMVRTAGWVTVMGMDEVNALATIDFSCDSIETGDYLEPFSDLALPTSADALGAPIFGDYANILFGTDGRTTFGDGDTLNIDRGTVHGVSPGARFAIYRNVEWGLPLVYIGDAVVLEQGELTSKVVLVRVKDSVEQGDVVVRRRSP